MSIYLKSDDLRGLFQYDYRVKTRILTIEQFNNLVDKFMSDAENKTQGDD